MLEIIATCADDILKIVQGGGQRIELVSALTEGGLTPSKALIEFAVKQSCGIPVMVMIRPHAMGFTYSQNDLRIMESDIETARECGAHGVVLGALTEEGDLDTLTLSRLLQNKGNLSVTFHRAIDASQDPVAAFKELLHYPIDRVLTSGGNGNITDNQKTLQEMVCLGKGQLELLAGGGITLENVSDIIEKTGIREVHVGTAVRRERSALLPILPEAIRAFLQKENKRE